MIIDIDKKLIHLKEEIQNIPMDELTKNNISLMIKEIEGDYKKFSSIYPKIIEIINLYY